MTSFGGRRPGSSRAGRASLSWPRTAAVVAAVLVVGYVGSHFFGGNDGTAEVAAPGSTVNQPIGAVDNPPSGGTRSFAPAAPEEAPGSPSPTSRGPGATTARPTSSRSGPVTWQHEILAAAPDAPIRLTPTATDWLAENIVIGRDLSGKFLGRVTLRYAGPGYAHGTFAVTLVRDGREVTTLTGDLGDVRAGTYQLMLSSTASWVEGPWTPRFRVVSTG